jgi:hypothetical protein
VCSLDLRGGKPHDLAEPLLRQTHPVFTVREGDLIGARTVLTGASGLRGARNPEISGAIASLTTRIGRLVRRDAHLVPGTPLRTREIGLFIAPEPRLIR